MSNKGDTGGQPAATTTISTIAVQAGDTQIIVTVLKCGELVKLQLTEANPNLLEIGSNQDETKKLLDEHQQLLIKLKKHEAGVWALLEEADRMAKEKKENEGEVYEAMANSLSDAWRTLILMLEKRRSLLHLASEFFDRALEFAIRIDEGEEFQSREQELADAECLKELLLKHSVMKRGLLEKSMLVLNKSRDLLDFLREFQTEEALQRSEALQGAHSSCGRVESLMEILQDRRRQVDQHMKQQLLDLEVILSIYQWDRQEQEVTHWFKSNADLYFQRDHLGSTLTENEELLREYKKFEEKAKDWSELVEKLLAKASELLAGEAEGRAETGHVSERSLALRALHEHFWNLMMGRLAHLQESNAFFSSANKAFGVLGIVESKLKGLKSQTLRLPKLAKKHEELLRSIKESATDPLQRGQLILQKVDPQSTQVEGVKRMLGYVRDRVDTLSRECHAHRALAAKRQQLVSTCEDLIDKVHTSLRLYPKCNTEPGFLLSQSEDMLNKHLELSSQTQVADAMAEQITELKTLECPEATEFSNKASLLEEELKTVTRNITSRIDNIRPYVGFLRIAEEVDEQMQSLHESYNWKPEEEENKESGVTSKEIADAKWQSMLERFLAMQDLGNNYINSSNMVSEDLNLNVRAAISVVEKTMEELNKKKMDLSDLWTSWQLHVNQVKSIKKQWKKYKEQLKKTVHDLKSVEEVLVPTSKVDLGSDLQTVSKLLENFSLDKPQFLQLNAEVEYMVKTSELLALKGIPIKEKSEKVIEMLHLHQRVKDNIKEYESVLKMAVKFHQLYEEVTTHSLSGMRHVIFAVVSSDQAKIQLIQHQDRQSHIRHLYKLAISLGGDISNTHASGFTVRRLQERLERLERGCVNWSTEANRCEESLTSNLRYCVFKEEITELRESFKDLKKKFNNVKFNYMKRNDKSRNLKAVKNQIQQIEIYNEKLQKRMQAFTVKVTSSTEKHLKGSSPREIEDAVNELQRQLGDFDKTVEEYRGNLDMSVKLQQAMEEYQFWCDEASATIVRVGKYSSQCKTREAVSILYKQFEKFVWPTVPQQEERISQITELAVRLHGAEEGKKYMEKTLTKHNEIVESIKELYNTCYYCVFVYFFQSLQGEPFSQDVSPLLPPAGGLTEGNLQRHNLMTEESLSNDEYECTSPDDISLPPLSETPESNIVLSENDLDLDGFCLSSQSHTIHINQYSHQLRSTRNNENNSQSQQRIREQTESCHSPTFGLNTKFREKSSSFVQSTLTVPAPILVSNTLSSILKSKGIPNLPNLPPVGPLGLNECHQTVYSVHESSVTETQECVHDPSSVMVRGAAVPSAFPAAATTRSLNTHATPSPLTTTAVTPTDPGQDPDLCNPTAIKEEIRLPGTSQSVGSTLAGQGPPHFSKLLSSPTVMEGSPVTLEVEVTGFPEPTLTWFKNGEKLTNDEHIELSQKKGKHALFVQKVTETDAGLYACRAVNPSGTLSSSAALQVKARNNSCPEPDYALLKLDWHTCFGTLCLLLYLLYSLLL
uniref:Coiled-coil domain containing 141 n=1 Tax=Oncorhynchus mykiss TaxID=8022 RepID=A0A8C7SFJ8_ONCMY